MLQCRSCTVNECCEAEAIEDAISRLRFDEIKDLIRLHGLNTSSCCTEGQYNGGIDLGNAAAASVSEGVSDDEFCSHPQQAQNLPSRVSSWRQKHLKVHSDATALSQVDAPSMENLVYCSDASVEPMGVVLGEMGNLKPLESITSAAVAVFTARTDAASRVDSTPGKVSSRHRLASSLRALDSIQEDAEEQFSQPQTSARSTHTVASQTSGWTIVSDKPPGPVNQTAEVGAMGVAVLEHGYVVETEGFHEVGSLDDPHLPPMHLMHPKVWSV
jgi:hypothetical protein